MSVTLQQAFVNFREQMIAAIENAPDETQRMLYEAELAVTELRGAEAVQLLRRVLGNLPNSYPATVALMRGGQVCLGFQGLRPGGGKPAQVGRHSCHHDVCRQRQTPGPV